VPQNKRVPLWYASQKRTRVVQNYSGGTRVLVGFGRLEAGCLLDSPGDGKQVVGLCGFEEIENAGRYAGSDEPDTLVLAADEVTDHKAEAAGVHVGNFGEIEDVDRRRGTMRRGIEDIVQGHGAQGGIHVPSCKWTGEAKDDGICGGVLPTLDGEGGAAPDLILYIRHRAFLVRAGDSMCNASG